MGGTIIPAGEGDDPGWQLDWRVLPAILMPQIALQRARQGDMLVGIRRAFIGLVGMMTIVAVVVVILGDLHRGKDQAALSLAIVLGDGALSLVLVRVFAAKLDASSPAKLATSWFQRASLRSAFALSVPLMGFALGVAMGPWWLYFVGLPFGVVGLVLAAPTRAALRRDQDRLSLQGCDVSLMAVLRSPEGR